MTPSLFCPASRRVLCVRLRNWPVDRLCRRQAALRASPLALVATTGNRRLIAAVCARAAALGVRPGIDQAEAMAVCPSLVCLPHNPAADARGLRSLGRWMMRFTPVVAVANGPDDPLGMPDALLLDVTGCERVFRGLHELVRQVAASLKRFQLNAHVALGPNPGAAWAMTFASCSLSPVSRSCDAYAASRKWGTSEDKCHPEGSGSDPRDLGVERRDRRTSAPRSLVGKPPRDDMGRDLASHPQGDAGVAATVLTDLPCEALRVEEDTVAKLYHLGIQTIGQLLAVPRKQLPARFGPLLTRRLDQILGHEPEPLVPLDPPVAVSARMDFDGVVTSMEALWAVFRELLGRVITQLERRGRGVRELDVTFTRAYAPTLVETIRLSRPSRDPVNLFNLFRCATERMDGRGDATDEFLGMRLLVRVHEPLGDEQIGLLDGENYAGERELDQLIERLCARMGERSVTQARAAESHVPERAFRRQLARDARPRPGSPKRPDRTKDDLDPRERHAPSGVRPLHLLRRPLEVRVMVSPPFSDAFGQPVQFTLNARRVHQLTHVVGPERIGGRWWDGHHKTRDYFDVEDETGKRFWLFRVNETRRWFLHGQYA